MAIQSLQKILQLENELYQSEQLEQGKISIWLQKQQEEIEQNHEQQLENLELKRKKFREKTIADAKAKSKTIINEAQEQTNCIDNLDDISLKKALQKFLPLISGHGS